MTKEEIVAALKGEKPASAQLPPDNKVNFTNKVGVATEEQAKYLEEILFQKDEQDSFKKVSRFISGSIDDAKVKEVLQSHTIMIGVVALPLKTEIAKEGFAFNRNGYFCYAIRLMRYGMAFGIEKGSSITVTPWDMPYGADAVIELVRSRKEKIRKQMGFLGVFNERDDAEIADMIAKAMEGEVTE